MLLIGHPAAVIHHLSSVIRLTALPPPHNLLQVYLGWVVENWQFALENVYLAIIN